MVSLLRQTGSNEGELSCGKVIRNSAAMPRLHLAAYQGDLVGLARAIGDGEDVNAPINLPNAQRHAVVGVTPLYLAAQGGHRQACALLVAAGADVLRTCSVPQSGDVFGPTDIALVHFNLRTWLYLSGLKKERLGRLSARRAYEGSSMVAPLMEEQHMTAI